MGNARLTCSKRRNIKPAFIDRDANNVRTTQFVMCAQCRIARVLYRKGTLTSEKLHQHPVKVLRPSSDDDLLGRSLQPAKVSQMLSDRSAQFF